MALSAVEAISPAIREYALLFYAGRYPALANMLFPPPAAPPAPNPA